MKLHEIIEISKKKSDTRLREIRDQLSLPFFRTKEQILWDGSPKKIVVVGSGIGGMASGALFARIGHHVTVLECNKTHIGGHGRCLTINGIPYSMGPQYVWEFGENMLGDRFLKFLDLKASNTFIPMAPDGFERFFIGNRDETCNYCFINFKVPMGLDNFRKELKRLFPEESEKLDALFDDMIAIFQTYKSHFRGNAANEGRFLVATKFLMTTTVPMEMKLKLGRCIYLSVKEFFDHYGINNIIRRILYGHGGIFAENESEMSAIAYIIGTGNYHEGAWYPRYGFQHFFDSLSSVIRSGSGSVKTGKKVVSLETAHSNVTKAVCEDGSCYECDFLFSDISPRLTHALLGRNTGKFDYTPSHSIPTCCIGITKSMEPIAEMKGRNYWWQDGNEVNYRNPDMTVPPQMLFIASPSANGFGKPENPSDDALVVFCPGNYEQEKRIYEKGPVAVEKFKQQLADNIIAILDQNVFPGIKSRVLFSKIISSIDIENDTNGESGNAYGRRLTADEILKGPIREENCPANLYNVSATKNSPGIAAGIFTAELIFKELTGREI
jgi:all-trans-retinol 13,14-reductase